MIIFAFVSAFISPEKHETNTLTAVIGAGAAVFLLVFVGIMIYVIRCICVEMNYLKCSFTSHFYLN